jgi:hypothetical protein
MAFHASISKPGAMVSLAHAFGRTRVAAPAAAAVLGHCASAARWGGVEVVRLPAALGALRGAAVCCAAGADDDVVELQLKVR